MPPPGRVDEAVGLFTSVLETKPDHQEATYNLAAAYYSQGLEHMDEVEALVKKVRARAAAAGHALATVHVPVPVSRE